MVESKNFINQRMGHYSPYNHLTYSKPTMATKTPLKMKATRSSAHGREYLLEFCRGNGRFSSVYKAFDAFDLHEEDPVALKLYREEVSYQRVFDELYHLSKGLSSPHMVRWLDYRNEKDQRYLVLEYVSRTLQDELLQGVSQQTILDYISQIPELLSFFHERDMAHCDIKPENIGYEDRRIIALDLGNAENLGEATGIYHREQEAEITPERMESLRIPAYNAPELRPADGYSMLTSTSDTYSAGKVLQLLLTRPAGEMAEEAIPKIEKHFGVHLPRSLCTLLQVMTHEEYPQRPRPDDLRVLAHYAVRDLQKKNYFDGKRIRYLPRREIKFLAESSAALN